MTVIDSLDITGMKKADFEQLEEIYLHFKDQGIYYGRKDYFDKRMERLEKWLDNTVKVLNDDCKIKENRK